MPKILREHFMKCECGTEWVSYGSEKLKCPKCDNGDNISLIKVGKQFKTKLEDGRILTTYEHSATEVVLFWGKPPIVDDSMIVSKDKWIEKYKDMGEPID